MKKRNSRNILISRMLYVVFQEEFRSWDVIRSAPDGAGLIVRMGSREIYVNPYNLTLRWSVKCSECGNYNTRTEVIGMGKIIGNSPSREKRREQISY